MARDVYVKIIGDPSSIRKAFGESAAAAKGFEAQMSRVAGSTEKLGKTMTRHVTLPLIAAGAASLKLAADFDQTISRMVGLAGVSQKQADAWRKAILEMAPAVGKAPEELANALYQIASSGVKGKAALDALTVSAKASTAGLGDTAVVADAVTSVMNAYAKTGMTAAKAADVLTATVREGKGEAAAFAPVLGRVIPVAAQLGVSFDQVGAALAAMTRLGTSADDSATQLSATFSGLLKTTPKAEKALQAVGLSSAGLREELREKGLLAVLQTLNERFHGSTVAMAEAFPNVRALRGVLALVGSAANDTSGVFERLHGSTGSLRLAFGAASKEEAFKLEQALASIKVSAIELGETLAPLASRIARDITKVTGAYNDLSPAQKEVATKLAEFAAVVGPTLILVGKLEKGMIALGVAAGATGAAGEVAMLRRRLLLLRGLSIAIPIVIGIELKQHDKQVGQFLDKIGLGFLGGYNASQHSASDIAASYPTLVKTFGKSQADKLLAASKSAGPGMPGSAVDSLIAGSLGSAGASRVAGVTGLVTPGLRAVELLTGARVNDDFARSGHAKNSYHYRGQAADLAVDQMVWARLYAHKDAFAELFGPWGLFHFGVQFFDAELQAGHMDHIHVAYTGGPAAISRMLGAGGGATSSPSAVSPVSDFDPLAGGKAAKVRLVTGAKLLSPATRVALARAGGTSGAGDDLAALKRARVELELLQKTAGKAERVPIAEELGRINREITAIDNAKLKAKLAEQKAAWSRHVRELQGVADAARGLFERAFGNLASVAMKEFDRQTQRGLAGIKKRLDTTVASLDLQLKQKLAGIAAEQKKLTPEERAVADFIAGRQAASAAAANDQRQADLAAAISGGDPAQIAAAQDAINQAALDEQQAGLQAAADASRVAADQRAQDAQEAAQAAHNARVQAARDSYDLAAQNYQDERDLQAVALQQQLDDLMKHLEARGTTIASANAQVLALMARFGLDPAWFTAGSAGGNALLAGLAAAFGQAGSTLGDYQDAANAAARAQAAGAGATQSQATAAAVAALKVGKSLTAGNNLLTKVAPGHLVKVPLMAAGGIAVRPTLAVIGESGPEAVLPLGRGGAGFGGGLTVQFHGPVYGDKKRVADELVDEIWRALLEKSRRNGGLSL